MFNDDELEEVYERVVDSNHTRQHFLVNRRKHNLSRKTSHDSHEHRGQERLSLSRNTDLSLCHLNIADDYCLLSLCSSRATLTSKYRVSW